MTDFPRAAPPASTDPLVTLMWLLDQQRDFNQRLVALTQTLTSRVAEIHDRVQLLELRAAVRGGEA